MASTLTRQEVKRRKRKADSVRRNTKGAACNFTAAEIRARKESHLAYLRNTMEAMLEPDGMRNFLISRELNANLTPLAQAAAAFGAPGRIVASAGQWSRAGHRIEKGQRAVCYGTKAPTFNPLPMFSEDQVGEVEWEPGAPQDEVGEPDADTIAFACETFAEAMASGKAPGATMRDWIAAIGL